MFWPSLGNLPTEPKGSRALLNTQRTVAEPIMHRIGAAGYEVKGSLEASDESIGKNP